MPETDLVCPSTQCFTMSLPKISGGLTACEAFYNTQQFERRRQSPSAARSDSKNVFIQVCYCVTSVTSHLQIT